MRRLCRAALTAAILAAAGGPAHASLMLCNRTSYVLYAATATLDPHAAEVRGWTRIVPGDCAVARPEGLTKSTYLVHARSSIAHAGPARAWGGKWLLCVREGDFTLKQPSSGATCLGDGSFPVGFAAIDNKGRPSWSMTLDEPEPLATMQAAQLAGVKRLLKDNGYKIGSINGEPDTATGASLADFRKKFAPQADNAQLFDILEERARQHVTPSGLTACNDGAVPLLVALGQIGHGKRSSRGWWTVVPRACARLQTVPLANDVLYVLAQTRDGVTVTGGSETYCITTAVFEIQGARDRCAARGYGEAGFLRVDARGSVGAVLHLGAAIKPPGRAAAR
mgnify:FL=1